MANSYNLAYKFCRGTFDSSKLRYQINVNHVQSTFLCFKALRSVDVKIFARKTIFKKHFVVTRFFFTLNSKKQNLDSDTQKF